MQTYTEYVTNKIYHVGCVLMIMKFGAAIRECVWISHSCCSYGLQTNKKNSHGDPFRRSTSRKLFKMSTYPRKLSHKAKILTQAVHKVGR